MDWYHSITTFFQEVLIHFKDPKADKSLRSLFSQYQGSAKYPFSLPEWLRRTRNLLLLTIVLPLNELCVAYLLHHTDTGYTFGKAFFVLLGFALTYPALATYGECFQGKGKRTSVHIMESYALAGLIGIFPGYGFALWLGPLRLNQLFGA